MYALLFVYHPEESAVLSLLLKQAGLVVQVAKRVKPPDDNWPEQPLDLICLVLENEQQYNLSTIKQLRGHTAVPMIVITEPLPEDGEISLIEAGVDLIVTKPFGFRLFVTEIRALLRRTAGVPFHGLPELIRGPLILDPSNRTIKAEEREPIKLTHLEFRLLYTLMTHAGQIIPTENIVEHVWGYGGEGNRDLVRGLVQRLRSKVELDQRDPRFILTEKGIGYYLVTDD